MSLRVVPCSLRKANDFVEVYHRHNLRTSRDGGKFAVAVVSESTVVGVAIVGNPLSATLMDGFTAEVLRACVLPDAPRNCNSLLYGACRRIWFEMGGAKILTYTSKRRWEAVNPHASVMVIGWPEPVADIREGGLFAIQPDEATA